MRTTADAVRGLERVEREVQEAADHMFDLVMAAQLRAPDRPAQQPRVQPPKSRQPSGGFPGYLFGGRS